MKLGPVTKIDKKNKITSKKFDDDVMLANFDVIVIYPIRKPDSGCIERKSYIFISSNLVCILQNLKTELKNF